MYLYAQIDDNNTIVSMSQLSGEVNLPILIPLTEDEFNRIGTGWRRVNGEWLEPVIPTAAVPYQPSNADVIQSIEDLKVDLFLAGVIDNVV